MDRIQEDPDFPWTVIIKRYRGKGGKGAKGIDLRSTRNGLNLTIKFAGKVVPFYIECEEGKFPQVVEIIAKHADKDSLDLRLHGALKEVHVTQEKNDTDTYKDQVWLKAVYVRLVRQGLRGNDLLERIMKVSNRNVPTGTEVLGSTEPILNRLTQMNLSTINVPDDYRDFSQWEGLTKKQQMGYTALYKGRHGVTTDNTWWVIKGDINSFLDDSEGTTVGVLPAMRKKDLIQHPERGLWLLRVIPIPMKYEEDRELEKYEYGAGTPKNSQDEKQPDDDGLEVFRPGKSGADTPPDETTDNDNKATSTDEHTLAASDLTQVIHIMLMGKYSLIAQALADVTQLLALRAKLGEIQVPDDEFDKYQIAFLRDLLSVISK